MAVPGGEPGERQRRPVRGLPPGLALGLGPAQNHGLEGGGRSPATAPGPQMAAPAGREEGHPPGCAREPRAQAGLGAINHPPPTAGKQPGGLASAGPHPSGPRRQMLGEAGWEALQEGEAKQQIPGPRVASHTRAQHNHGPLKATEPPRTPSWGGGGEETREGENNRRWDVGVSGHQRSEASKPEPKQHPGTPIYPPHPCCLLAPRASVFWLTRSLRSGL